MRITAAMAAAATAKQQRLQQLLQLCVIAGRTWATSQGDDCVGGCFVSFRMICSTTDGQCLVMLLSRFKPFQTVARTSAVQRSIEIKGCRKHTLQTQCNKLATAPRSHTLPTPLGKSFTIKKFQS
jgi:hypothetical protein